MVEPKAEAPEGLTPVRSDLLLVKDLDQSGIYYYWQAISGDKLSPNLATLDEVKEWFCEYAWSFYPDIERRKRVCDRRSGVERRKNLDRATFGQRRKSRGRRSTDILMKVDKDLFSEKIQQFHLDSVIAVDPDGL